MNIRVVPTPLEGVLVIETDFVRDDRGFFIETWHKQRYAEHGIHADFVQDNHSRSSWGVLRGIHYQDLTAPMAKLVRCTHGRVFDVTVDLRLGSPTFGRWNAVELTAENMKQVFVPIGVGHAFLTLSDEAEFEYKCTNYYVPSAEGALIWNDPDIAVAWPLEGLPILSPRDRDAMSLAQYLEKPAFHWNGEAFKL